MPRALPELPDKLRRLSHKAHHGACSTGRDTKRLNWSKQPQPRARLAGKCCLGGASVQTCGFGSTWLPALHQYAPYHRAASIIQRVTLPPCHQRSRIFLVALFCTRWCSGPTATWAPRVGPVHMLCHDARTPCPRPEVCRPVCAGVLYSRARRSLPLCHFACCAGC